MQQSPLGCQGRFVACNTHEGVSDERNRNKWVVKVGVQSSYFSYHLLSSVLLWSGFVSSPFPRFCRASTSMKLELHILGSWTLEALEPFTPGTGRMEVRRGVTIVGRWSESLCFQSQSPSFLSFATPKFKEKGVSLQS